VTADMSGLDLYYTHSLQVNLNLVFTAQQNSELGAHNLIRFVFISKESLSQTRTNNISTNAFQQENSAATKA
jgi:hypothetical protein